MALQTFLMVQLGVLALGLGAAFGWRGLQMRRQMTLLIESLDNPIVAEAATSEPKAAETPAEAAPSSEEPDKATAEPEADAEPEVESEPEDVASTDAEEATEEATETAAEAEADEPTGESDFDDLDDLLDPNAGDPDEAQQALDDTQDDSQNDTAATEGAEPTNAEVEPLPSEPEAETAPEAAEAPAVEIEDPPAGENGLRALVTKFAAENRQLLEQVHTLEDEVKRLEALQAADAEPEPGQPAEASSEETSTEQAKSEALAPTESEADEHIAEVAEVAEDEAEAEAEASEPAPS